MDLKLHSSFLSVDDHGEAIAFFHSWQSLVHPRGLEDHHAVELMTALVRAAAGHRPRRGD
jgi:hypothetical protein